MYGAILPELLAARRADLLHEAAHARRIAAARRNGATAPTAWRWRRRVAATLIALAEAVAGGPAAVACPSGSTPASGAPGIRGAWRRSKVAEWDA